MIEEELLEILHYGEGVEIECKKSANALPKDIWPTYSAMANTNGGVIFLGVVEDEKAYTFDIHGVANVSKILKDFWNTINSNKVSKNILADGDVKVIEFGSKSVIKINIPRASYKDKPIYVNENPYYGTYKRQNDGDYRCSLNEVNSLIRDASEVGIDYKIIVHRNMDDIDLKTLEKYRNHFKAIHSDHVFIDLNDQEFLRHLGGLTKDKKTGNDYLTQAGLLLFGKGLSIREEFPDLNLDYLDKRDLIGDQRWSDRLTIDFAWENNLYNFYTRVLRKIVDDLKRPFKLDLDTLARVDDTPVHAAVREAFANAVIHSDYNIRGTLRIERHKTHFVFSNPGTLKLSLQEIFQGGKPIARNPTIQKCFRMIGYGESIGSGFPTIIKAWTDQHWRFPQLEENHHTRDVTLTLWMTSLIPKECLEKLEYLFAEKINQLTTMEILALSTAEMEGKVSNTSLQSISDMHGQDIGKMLANLVRQGFLNEEGYGRGKKYFLNEKDANNFNNKSDEIKKREEEIFELLKQNQRVSRKLIMETFNLSQKKVQATLTNLTEQRKIKRIGTSRSGHWEILDE